SHGRLLPATGCLISQLLPGAAGLASCRTLSTARALLSELRSAAARLLSELSLLARSSGSAGLPLSALLTKLPLLPLLLLPLRTRCAGRRLAELLGLAWPSRLPRPALLPLLALRSWPTRSASAELLLLPPFAAWPRLAELMLSRSSRSPRSAGRLASSALSNLRVCAARRLFSELLRLPLRLTLLSFLPLLPLLLDFLLLVGVYT